MSDTSGFTSQNSDWGQANIQFSGSDLTAFDFDASTSTYSGFVNVVTTVPGGGTNNWAVQNLPVEFTSSGQLLGRLPDTVRFDLGVTPGTNVSNLDYLGTINTDPLGAAPTGTFTTASVTADSVLFGGVSGNTGMQPPPPAQNFVGGDPGTKTASAGTIAGTEKNVPAVAEEVAGCAPAAVARSIKYLAAQHPKRVNVPASAQDVYNILKDTNHMKTVIGGFGTNPTLIVPGKDQYVKENKLPIKTIEDPSFARAIKTLKHKGAVEISLTWPGGLRGHCAFVSQIIPIVNEKHQITGYTVRYIDDPTQGDATAANEESDIQFDANGRGPQATLNKFIDETVSPEPGPVASLGIAATIMLGLLVRRRICRPSLAS